MAAVTPPSPLADPKSVVRQGSHNPGMSVPSFRAALKPLLAAAVLAQAASAHGNEPTVVRIATNVERSYFPPA